MSHTQILEELPNLRAEERRQIFERLCELQEQDLLRGTGPSDAEKELLDSALAEFQLDCNIGDPWREVLARISSGSK